MSQGADKPQICGPFTTNKWNSRILFHDRAKGGKTTNATAAANTNTASVLCTASATLETNASAMESIERKFQQQLAKMAAKLEQNLLEQNNTLEQEASEARLIQALPSKTNLVAQMKERLDQQTNQMTQQMTHQMTQKNMIMANSMENFMHQLSQQFGIQPATPSNGRHPGAPPFVRRRDHQPNENQPELQSNLDETSDNLDQSMQGTSFSEAQDGPTLSAFTATINGNRLSPIPPTTHGVATTTATTAPAKENIYTSDTSMMSGSAEEVQSNVARQQQPKPSSLTTNSSRFLQCLSTQDPSRTKHYCKRTTTQQRDNTTMNPPETQPPPVRLRPQRPRQQPPRGRTFAQQTMTNNNSNGRNAAATQSSQPLGDTLQIPIDKTKIIRFYYQNVNGLKLHNQKISSLHAVAVVLSHFTQA